MDANFWHDKWERNEIGFHLSEANPLLTQHFPQLNLEKGQRIFLPLCGKTLDIDWLLDAGMVVVGIELNEGAVTDLFKHLAVEYDVKKNDKFTCYSADNIKVFVGDLFDLTTKELGVVDAVYDRAAIVALPETIRQKYSQHLMQITNKAKQLIINYEYDQSIISGPPFSVNNDELKHHYGNDFTMQQLMHQSVPGGLKGRCPATENVWLLTNTE